MAKQKVKILEYDVRTGETIEREEYQEIIPVEELTLVPTIEDRVSELENKIKLILEKST